jgi:membrane fusion protein, heavy metal efflux system
MSLRMTEEWRGESMKNETGKKEMGAPRRGRLIVLGVIALVAAAGLLFAYARRGKREEVAAPAAAESTGTVKFLMEQQWRIRMKLALVEEQTVARQVTATGRVIPAANHQAVVAPPVGGVILRGNLPRVGQSVKEGQLIATLQQTATSAEQAQVRAAQAQARIEAVRIEAERGAAAGEANATSARLDLARREAERAKRLYEQKAYSQRQLEAAEAELRTAQAASEAAQARVKALEAARDVAQSDAGVGGPNGAYAVHAPIGGVVTKVSKSIGERVAPGEAILEVTNFDTVWVEAPIFERDLALVKANGKASFTTAAYPGQEFRGELIDVGEIIDEQKRAAHVIFAVPNKARALRVGMQADVRLDASESVKAMMIPREAALDDEGKKIVYVLLSGEEFQRREVKLGDEHGGKVAVLEGLKPGERVVTQGALQLKLQELNPAGAPAHTHET